MVSPIQGAVPLPKPRPPAPARSGENHAISSTFRSTFCASRRPMTAAPLKPATRADPPWPAQDRSRSDRSRRHRAAGHRGLCGDGSRQRPVDHRLPADTAGLAGRSAADHHGDCRSACRRAQYGRSRASARWSMPPMRCAAISPCCSAISSPRIRFVTEHRAASGLGRRTGAAARAARRLCRSSAITTGGTTSSGARAALAQVRIPVMENDAVLLGEAGRRFWLAGLGDQLAYRLGHGRFRGVDDLPGTLEQDHHRRSGDPAGA